MTFYEASVVYWHGDPLDSSEPVRDYSPEFAQRTEANSWGQAKANSPSPWPDRTYEDSYEITAYTLVDGLPEATHRWVYEGGRLTEELDGIDI